MALLVGEQWEPIHAAPADLNAAFVLKMRK